MWGRIFFTFKAVMGLASSCVKRVFFPCHTKAALDITWYRSTTAWANHVDAALLLFLHLNSSAASLALTPKFSPWILSCNEGLMWLKTHGKEAFIQLKAPWTRHLHSPALGWTWGHVTRKGKRWGKDGIVTAPVKISLHHNTAMLVRFWKW